MKTNFNLNGNITIQYNNETLIDNLQYRLLNLIITQSSLSSAAQELNIPLAKALSVINKMNKLSPTTVVEIEKGKHEVNLQISDFGMRLLNVYAQKEFDLYIFLKKSSQQLNNSIITQIEETSFYSKAEAI
jgi:molybdate transport repressor ModE-like protein